MLKAHKLDAMLFPGGGGAGIAARAGYPTSIVPFAHGAERADAGVPGRLQREAGAVRRQLHRQACSEPRLIELAYAFEQATKKRVPPPLFP